MSFPPYPEKFNTYYNTGYKQFWGAGFPYIKDDFVGGYSGLQYPSDDEDKVRPKPVMDLQNISSGKGKPKKKNGGRKMLSEDHPMYEPDVKIQPFKHSLSNKSPPHDIPKPRKKKSEKKELEGGCMDCGDNEKMGGRRRKKKASEKVSKKGGDKKAIRVKDVMKYKHDNDVSLKDAWKHFKGC